MDYTIKIGGEAGQGIQTIGDTLGRVFARAGYHVFSHQDYESRIRGGHNFYQIRVSARPISSSREKIRHSDSAGQGQHYAACRTSWPRTAASYTTPLRSKRSMRALHFSTFPLSISRSRAAASAIMENTVATGAVLGMLGIDIQYLLDNISRDLPKKRRSDRGGEPEGRCRRARVCGPELPHCSFPLGAGHRAEPRMLMGGVESIALGALASGCKFYAAYPMTPSTGIMNYPRRQKQEYGIVVEQAEDEIAAINMAIGASFAGVRAMTGTSGGGFALMVEGLSLAAHDRNPGRDSARPAARSGNRVSDEDRTGRTAIRAVRRTWRVPAGDPCSRNARRRPFISRTRLSISRRNTRSRSLSSSIRIFPTAQWTVDGFDIWRLVYRDYRVRGEDFEKMTGYKRHAYTETGVSPLAVPGEASRCRDGQRRTRRGRPYRGGCGDQGQDGGEAAAQENAAHQKGDRSSIRVRRP